LVRAGVERFKNGCRAGRGEHDERLVRSTAARSLETRAAAAMAGAVDNVRRELERYTFRVD
jgi:hypothetical protein